MRERSSPSPTHLPVLCKPPGAAMELRGGTDRQTGPLQTLGPAIVLPLCAGLGQDAASGDSQWPP